MADYVSKGAALGTSIPALVLGGVAAAGQLLGGCNNRSGLFGLGNNCNDGKFGAELQYVSNLQAENAMLKSERYTDKSIIDSYKQSIADNKQLRNEMYAYIAPIASQVANDRVDIATLQAELKCCCEKQQLREEILAGKINEVALTANGQIATLTASTNGQFNALNNTITCMQNLLGAITTPVVKNSSVCPGWGNVTITPAAATTTPAA